MDTTTIKKLEGKRIIPSELTQIKTGKNSVAYFNEKLLKAKFYIGSRKNPVWYTQFRTAERMHEIIDEYISRSDTWETAKEERAAERKAFKTTLKKGDILHGSWGWEQTNCEFYEVDKVKNNKVTLVRLTNKHVQTEGFHMAADVMPGDRTDEKIEGQVTLGENVKVSRCCTVSPWNGKPKYSSWYA